MKQKDLAARGWRDKTWISLQASGKASLKSGLELHGTANRGDQKLTAAEQVPEIMIPQYRLSDSQKANKLFRTLNC